MTLKELKPGQQGKVTSVGATGPMKRRIMDMGVTPGVNVRGYELSLRKEEAAQIQMEM